MGYGKKGTDTVFMHQMNTSHPAEPQDFSALKRKILQEYASITFDEAVEYMHFSQSHFSKLFREAFGMPFTQYLNAVRIYSAIGMLRKGQDSITEISIRCGFKSIRNFNRAFKNLTGCSPSNLPPDYAFGEALGLPPTESEK